MIQLYLMVSLTVTTAIGIPFMIFVSWRHGNECWTKFAPYFYGALTLTIFFIFPVVFFCFNVGLWIFTTDQHDSVYSAWCIAFMVI